MPKKAKFKYYRRYKPIMRFEQIIGLGILIMILGFMIIFFGIINAKEGSSKAKVAFGGFIGPIPFGFGNDKNTVKFVAVLSAVLLIIWVLFRIKG